jgi:hypothetical protein
LYSNVYLCSYLYILYIFLYHHISGRFFTVVGDEIFDPKRQVVEVGQKHVPVPQAVPVPDQGAAQGGMGGFTKVGLNGI